MSNQSKKMIQDFGKSGEKLGQLEQSLMHKKQQY
jgi:hypothetical protein